MPRKERSSDTLVGGAIFIMDRVFLSRGSKPSVVTLWPKASISVWQKLTFFYV